MPEIGQSLKCNNANGLEEKTTNGKYPNMDPNIEVWKYIQDLDIIHEYL